MIEKEQLYEAYFVKKLSLRKVAILLGCSHQKVRSAFKRYGFQLRGKSEELSGTRNPMYGVAHSKEDKIKIANSLRLRSHEEFCGLIKGFTVVTNYEGEEKPITLKCNGCGLLKKYKQAKNAHLRSIFCKVCDKKIWQKGGKGKAGRSGRKRKYGFNEVVSSCLENKIKFLDQSYEGINVYHNFKCDKNHKFKKPFGEMIRSFRKGTNGCRLCNYESLKSSELHVKSKLQERGFELLSKYVNSRTKSEVKCLKCQHSWKVAIYSIISLDSGCPKCNLYLNEKLTGTFLKELFPGISILPFTLKEKIINNKKIVRNRLYIDYKFKVKKRLIFVEYHGIQHYESVRFGSKITNLEEQKIRDSWLRKYCKLNNIVLVEIDGRKIQKNRIMEFLIKKFNKLGIPVAI